MNWYEFTVGIVSSLMATAIVAAISFLAIFRPLVSSAKRALEASLHPVNEIPDVAALAILLAETMSAFKEDYRRVVIYRALPCEISVQFLKHCFGNHASSEAIAAVRTYHQCVSTIIKEGDGAHDKTIFGRTGIASLDETTRDACLSDFLGSGEVGDTCEFGLHDNFNEIGIFLVGHTIEQRRADVKEWKAGYIMVFSEDFKTVRGFRHNVHGHIENLRVIFEERKRDCEQRKTYFMLSGDETSDDVLATVKETICNFFDNRAL
jgi:hypothetical protein